MDQEFKMPFDTEVSLGPVNIVLDGDPAAPAPPKGAHHLPHCYMGTQFPPKGAQPPMFDPCLLWPNAKRSPISATAEHLFIII